ncbi:hypothetical protein O0I10_004378 [Lichtheimia ornata]|uniref:Cep192-like domain-containing protein n=1 Tax=Lichtheimia ornata TaxID=688661 RepID=A0AAD7V6M0_9FUNG|nr:uncharacterized protein O0I10_004378 [Lichtheimia ornata]KAJ8659785.1 hypothetical protein O0I10_004378 [Lichtheimia ornata]
MSFNQDSPISDTSSHHSLFGDTSKGKVPLTRSAAVKTNLYKHLDKLEASVNADFEKYAAETLARSFPVRQENMSRGEEVEENGYEEEEEEEAILGDLEHVPFVGDTRPPFGSDSIHGLSDVSAHSDREILGHLLDKEKNDDDDEYAWVPDQDLVDEKYSVSPLINHPSGNHHQHRPISPGQYFAARSLPLDSLDIMFNKSSTTNNTIEDPLSFYFKALPSSLSHRHCHRKPSYIIEPNRILLQATSETSGHTQLKITNTSDKEEHTFSVFSSRAKLRFHPRDGVVSPRSHVEVMIRARRSAIHGISKRGSSEHASDTILLLMDDGRYTQRIPVDIRSSEDEKGKPTSTHKKEQESGSEDEKHPPSCPFCALEDGCFLPK